MRPLPESILANLLILEKGAGSTRPRTDQRHVADLLVAAVQRLAPAVLLLLLPTLRFPLTQRTLRALCFHPIQVAGTGTRRSHSDSHLADPPDWYSG